MDGKQHGGKTPAPLPIRKLIPIGARRLNHLLVHPSEFPSSIMAALRATRKQPHSKFSKTGTMNTSRPTNLICEIKFGSHLYGTATEASDEDYIGIFLPSLEEILLGRIPKTANSSPKDDTRKNEAGELDATYYSLHHFLRLATQGQTGAIDMLFAPENMVYKSPEYGWVWDRIVENRSLLVSKQMNAFVGYARGQASKYSLKGDRLNRLREFHTVVNQAALRTHGEGKLDEVWDILPKDDERTNPQGTRELQIGGKWFGATTSVGMVEDVIGNTIKRYGKRANAAATAEGHDWKALSHAVRVSKELIELLTYGRINFPLADAPLLLDIKLGNVPMERVQDILDSDLAFVEVQAAQSHLPETVDRKFWDDELKQIMMDHLSNEIVRIMK